MDLKDENFRNNLKGKYENSINPMIALKMGDHLSWQEENISGYRSDEQITCSYAGENEEEVLMQVILSERANKMYEAALSMVRTTFILCLL